MLQHWSLVITCVSQVLCDSLTTDLSQSLILRRPGVNEMASQMSAAHSEDTVTDGTSWFLIPPGCRSVGRSVGWWKKGSGHFLKLITTSKKYFMCSKPLSKKSMLVKCTKY